MSVGKVAIADATRTVAASISLILIGEVWGVRRGRWVNQDRRSGESQQLGEKQIA